MVSTRVSEFELDKENLPYKETMENSNPKKVPPFPPKIDRAKMREILARKSPKACSSLIAPPISFDHELSEHSIFNKSDLTVNSERLNSDLLKHFSKTRAPPKN